MRYQFFFYLLLLSTFIGCTNANQAREKRNPLLDKAQAQLDKVADMLDQSTTDTGVYIRVEEDEIKETDPWGTQLRVNYSQGGVAESVAVRSAGPDTQFNTPDDIVSSRMAMNMKGIGEGIKKNAEETAANAAKGAVKGTVEGVKDSVKDAIPFLKKKEKDAEEKPEADEVEAEKPEE